MRGISWIAERLLDSQGFFPMELFSQQVKYSFLIYIEFI
jgi:hypothetical protein